MNWIDTAEQNQVQEQNLTNTSPGNEELENRQIFLQKIKTLKGFSERINNIDYEHKQPCRHISFLEQGKDTYFVFFSTAGFEKKSLTQIFSSQKTELIYTRKIKFNISGKTKSVSFYISEKFSEDKKSDSNYSQLDSNCIIRKKYKLKTSSISEDIISNIIDWLAFKNQIDDWKNTLPIYK